MHQRERHAQYLTQSRLENEVDVLKRLHMRRLSELKVLNNECEIEQRLRDELQASARLQEEANQQLRQSLEKSAFMIRESSSRMTFERDYAQRQRYYELRSPEENLGARAEQILNPKDKTLRVIVSPEGLPDRMSRAEDQLRYWPDQGWTCLAYDARVGSELKTGSDGIHRFGDERGLLNELIKRRMRPVVLCTSVQQCAWYDLLPIRTLWYDIGEEAEEGFREDPNYRFKHLELLKRADLITYSSARGRKRAYGRSDALRVGTREENEALMSRMDALLQRREQDV